MSHPSDSHTPRSEPRFGLLVLLFLSVVIVIGLGLFSWDWNQASKKRHAAASVKDIGGDVRFGKPPEATGLISGWLHLLLGDEYFADATHVRFKPRSEEDLELLRAYPDLQSLGLYGPGVTDAVLRKLPDVLQLESLQIGSAAISEQGLHALKAQPNLSCIHFTNCEVLKRESPQAMQRLPAYGRFIVAHRRHMLIGQLEQLRKVCSGGGDEVRQRRRVIL